MLHTALIFVKRKTGTKLMVLRLSPNCENAYKCPRAKVYVQKAEIEFLRNPHPIDHRYYSDVLDGVDVVEV